MSDAQRTKPGRFHPLALVECEAVGEGTRIWAFAHVMKGARVGAGCNLGEGVFVERGVSIGDNVTVKNGVALYDGITVEDDVFIGFQLPITWAAWGRPPIGKILNRKNRL